MSIHGCIAAQRIFVVLNATNASLHAGWMPPQCDTVTVALLSHVVLYNSICECGLFCIGSCTERHEACLLLDDQCQAINADKVSAAADTDISEMLHMFDTCLAAAVYRDQSTHNSITIKAREQLL